jgi:choline-sulfatase
MHSIPPRDERYRDGIPEAPGGPRSMATISRRHFGKTLVKGLGGAAVAAAMPGSLAQTGVGGLRRPNIVFVFSDQHSYKYTGYAGHPHVRTPNLDRIAREGVVFSSAYCQNPVCAPSRASMISGMYASDCGSYCNSTVWDGSHPSWAAMLRDAGYHCWASGKHDLNPAFDIGFNEQVDVRHGHLSNPDITSLFRRPVGYRMEERGMVDGRDRAEPNQWDKPLFDHAERFIRERAPTLAKPFVLYAGAMMPHPAFVSSEEHFKYYYPDRVDMPEIPEGHLENLHLMFQELRHFKRVATPIPLERVRRARAAYYGMITELDGYVGNLRRALEETGQLDNTLFVYASDHGESLGDHGLWYKNNLFDVAARVPLVMSGPGIPKGRRVDTPVGLVDLVRTFLEWGQAKAHSKLRGHSLIPLMHGRRGDHPGFAYSESHSEGNCTGSFMIRKGEWKYIHFSWHDDLLFNVREDPGEFVNRIDDPAAAPIREELKAILHSQVDPEEVTMRAFRTQDRMLAGMGERMSEEELFDRFRGRLGPGQARIMAMKAKGR